MGRKTTYFFEDAGKGAGAVGNALGPFSSQREYATTIRRVLAVAGPGKGRRTALYEREIRGIKKGGPLIEKTPWGGVSLKYVNVEGNRIRKLLVIRKRGVLGFEYHRRKRERLRVIEGKCLVYYSDHGARGWARGKLSWKIARPGDRFYFRPFDEHGMVALADTVIEERSTNDLDDIVFVYRL